MLFIAKVTIELLIQFMYASCGTLQIVTSQLCVTLVLIFANPGEDGRLQK